MICASFTQEFAAQEPEHFIQHLLLQQLDVKHLIVGDDFCFGKNRAGNFALLQKAADEFGFGLTPTASLKQRDQRVSSTLIRQALANDALAGCRYVRRPFSLMGRVRHGQKVGRQLGFPTANVWLYRKNYR
ncbi:MAG: riboflavin kinase [Rheinheimera sp.]|nr:riboflavin kinase [Rheinheimera sp.]